MTMKLNNANKAMKPQHSSKKQHVTGQLWPYFKFHQLEVKHFPITRQISYFRDGNNNHYRDEQ